MKQKFLLLGAVFFGILAFVLTYNQIQVEKKRVLGEAETVYLVRLTRDMAAGEELKERDIARVAVRRLRGQLTGGRDIAWRQASVIVGRHLESSKVKGDVLQWDDLKPLSRRKGFPSLIKPGFRAVSIAVDATSAVTNLIQPDDNIDLLGTFRFPDAKGDSALDTVTLTILQNVKVLAVGNVYGANAESGANNSMRTSYSNVTLMLTPEEVEMVVFAAQKGRLSLSLRNFEETRIISTNQSINFRYLERNLPKYNAQRERLQQGR